MTRALARELGEANIRVKCVIPGAVRTPRQMALWHTPEEEAKILAQQCLKVRVDPSTWPRWCSSWPPTTRASAPATDTGSTPVTADGSRDEQPLECVWPSGRARRGADLVGGGSRPSGSSTSRAAIHRYHEPSGENAIVGRAGTAGLHPADRDGGLHRRPENRPASLQPEDRRVHAAARRGADTPEQSAQRRLRRCEGYLWFGSMDDNEEDHRARSISSTDKGCMRRDAATSSPMVRRRAPTARMLYHTDTLAKSHLCFRPRPLTGRSPNKRVFARLTPAAATRTAHRGRRGLPVDRRYSAAGALNRYSPEGRTDRARCACPARTSPRPRSAAAICRRSTSPPRDVALERRRAQGATAGRRLVPRTR